MGLNGWARALLGPAPPRSSWFMHHAHANADFEELWEVEASLGVAFMKRKFGGVWHYYYFQIVNYCFFDSGRMDYPNFSNDCTRSVHRKSGSISVDFHVMVIYVCHCHSLQRRRLRIQNIHGSLGCWSLPLDAVLKGISTRYPKVRTTAQEEGRWI